MNIENINFEIVKEKLRGVYCIKNLEGMDIAEVGDILGLFEDMLGPSERWDLINIIEDIGLIKKRNNKGTFTYYEILIK